MHCWRAEASEPTEICLRYWSNKAIGRTVNCEAVLAYFLRVCSASPTKSRGAFSRYSSVSDARHCAALDELSSMVEACFPLFSSLRRRDATFYQLQLSLVGFCKSPCSYIANVQNLHARSSYYLKIFTEKKLLEVCAILVRFVYLDRRKQTTVGLTYIITYILMKKCSHLFTTLHTVVGLCVKFISV